jgi:hypothetical protein
MDRGSVTYKNPVYFFRRKYIFRGGVAGKSVKNANFSQFLASLVLAVRTKITAFVDIKAWYISYLSWKIHPFKMKFRGSAVNKYNDSFGKNVIFEIYR